MAIKFPQHDRIGRLTGGSDIWNNPAGDILIQDYFDAAVTSVTRMVKISGSFVAKPLMIKVGGVFVEKTAQVKVGGIFA